MQGSANNDIMIYEKGRFLMTRFIFSMPIDVYRKLRKKAFDRNISMAKYVLHALIWRLEQEED